MSSAICCLTRSDIAIFRSISFIDLAGHEKYMKTALHGIVGRAPQFCLLAISAVAGARYQSGFRCFSVVSIVNVL